jgi:hypothetical protein
MAQHRFIGILSLILGTWACGGGGDGTAADAARIDGAIADASGSDGAATDAATDAPVDAVPCVCDFANGQGHCDGSGDCIFDACDEGFDDCDQQLSNGCEADVTSAACVCVPGSTQSCYTGDPATLNVGPCQAGLQTCLVTGLGYGGCVGEVIPVAEICADNTDNDCSGTPDHTPDFDGDGFTVCAGDCCETTDDCAVPARVNAGALELATPNGETAVDDDCNGTIDDVLAACDSGLALTSTDPSNAARALGMCGFTTAGEVSPGVISSAYTRADGTVITPALNVGLLADFGTNVAPQEGARLLGLSSGYARDAADPGPCGAPTCYNGLTNGVPPSGFPQPVIGCSISSNINDDVAYEIQLRAPSNVTGVGFDFFFYSFEYPEWVCTSFNDQFVAIVSPAPAGAINGNVAYDVNGNAVSVSGALMQVCSGCTLGTSELVGTGFDVWNDAGGTGWLTAAFPITGGEEFIIRFMIWDTGDSAYDSTVLIDNLRWVTM